MLESLHRLLCQPAVQWFYNFHTILNNYVLSVMVSWQWRRSEYFSVRKGWLVLLLVDYMESLIYIFISRNIHIMFIFYIRQCVCGTFVYQHIFVFVGGPCKMDGKITFFYQKNIIAEIDKRQNKATNTMSYSQVFWWGNCDATRMCTEHLRRQITCQLHHHSNSSAYPV